MNKFFSSTDKYVGAKLFFEGKGLIHENKMEHPVEKWKGVPIILTSNNLPKVMRPQVICQNEDEYAYAARCNDYAAFYVESQACKNDYVLSQ